MRMWPAGICTGAWPADPHAFRLTIRIVGRLAVRGAWPADPHAFRVTIRIYTGAWPADPHAFR